MTDPTPLGRDGGRRGREPVLLRVPAWGPYALAVHGGAGPRGRHTDEPDRSEHEAGLKRSLSAGEEVLQAGGSAADAVCAAVVQLEDCELFNAGVGAALTQAGTAELDACLMTGDGCAGAVAVARYARNPILAARAVMAQTRHVLLADPDPRRLREWGCAVADPAEFVTQRALTALADRAGSREPRGSESEAHGTVGAVARDRDGRVAAATSTGGLTGQLVGRIGDSPLPGAGTFADDATLAISATGTGEFFVRGAFAHDVFARMRYGGWPLDEALAAALTELIAARGADGGAISVTPAGDVVLAYNSEQMYRGYLDARGPTALI